MLSRTVKMKCNLTVPILVVSLLFQNHICQGKRRIDKSDDDEEDKSIVLNERHAVVRDRGIVEALSKANRRTALRPEVYILESDDAGRKVNVHDKDLLDGRDSDLRDASAHGNIESDELSASESNAAYRSEPRDASATGISVGHGWAMGYGKASVYGESNRGYVNGPDAAVLGGRSRGSGGGGPSYNPGIETAEEYAYKSGSGIAIGRVGGAGSGVASGGVGGAGSGVASGGVGGAGSGVANGRFGGAGRSGEESGVSYPLNERGIYDSNERIPVIPIAEAIDETGYEGYGNPESPVRPVKGADNARGTYDRGYGNQGVPNRPVTNTEYDRDRGIYNGGSGNEGTLSRPVTNTEYDRDRGIYNGGLGNEGTLSRPVKGVDDRIDTYDRKYVNGEAPSRPATGADDEKDTYDRRYHNEKPPSRPLTGVHDEKVAYDSGYDNGRAPSRPSTGDRGVDRTVTDDGYPIRDTTGVRIPPTINQDGRVVYAYRTDGRPVRVIFRDGNGGVGVVNHFYEKKNLDNGVSGNGKITGTSFKSGFSLAYGGGGDSGNAGAVAYGSGISVPQGNGGKNTGGVEKGSGTGDGVALAYGSGGNQAGAIAFSSGSGYASGQGITLGEVHFGSRNRQNPKSGAHSIGYALRQGTMIGNGRAFILA